MTVTQHQDYGELGLDPARIAALLDAAAEHVERGPLPSLQLALAVRGKLALEAAWGEVQTADGPRKATPDTLYIAYSTTKAVVAAALWLLFQDGKLSPEQRVVELVPEFDTQGKDAVTLRHLLTHTAGFPDAPFSPLDWADKQRRYERFARWRLDFEPGQKLQYHATSAHYVIAEVIERASGQDFREFIRARVLEPLELTETVFVGLPEQRQGEVAHVSHVGEAPDPAQLAAMGIRLPANLENEAYLERFNQPDFRSVGVPGAGGVMTAGGLAQFYQGLLKCLAGERDEPWQQNTLRQVLEPCTGELLDSMTRRAANRGLGLVIAGDDERVFRSFAPTNSPESFGHAGAGGQVAWADPGAQLSFVCFTNGIDRNTMQMGIRGIALSTQAVATVARKKE